MLTVRGRRISVCNGTLEYSNRKFRGDNGYGSIDRSEGCRDCIPSKTSSTSSVSLNCSYSTGAGYIEHRVSKFDTLAGIAIMYGVEVADITKLNGLVTALQMFALKSLRIPLPGKHPPSPFLSNGFLHHLVDSSEQASSSASNSNPQDLFDSFQSLEKKISPAMNSLQGYYGLKPRNQRASEGFDQKESSHLQGTPFPATNSHLNHHRKSKSLVDAVIAKVNNSSNTSKAEVNSDKPTRRRQKSEADFVSQAPELLLKEENRSINGGKGLALRSKATSRPYLSTDTKTSNSNVGDSLSKTVRESSSLQEPDCNSNGSSIWVTLKPEMVTQAAITNFIVDGLSKAFNWSEKQKGCGLKFS